MLPNIKASANVAIVKKEKGQALKKMKKHWQLYLVVFLPVLYVIVFQYIPMVGVQIAFKNYNLSKGIFGSPWIGFKHFKTFLTSYQFGRLMLNTLGLSIYQIVAGFFPPIILALALNYSLSRKFGKTVQMVTYMPHFISTVLIVAIVTQVLSINGVVNTAIKNLGVEPIQFLGEPSWFKSVYVWSGIWQGTGYNAILYLAAIAGINPELYEAATVDGASIWKRIWHIDIPGIMPTAIILLILSTGKILNIGYEKVLLLQNQLNMQSSDIISTYVYRMGLVSMQYSYSSAINLMQSFISLILIVTVNGISRKVSENSLW
jgi:ABC-type polysaccharide transport system, permease component